MINVTRDHIVTNSITVCGAINSVSENINLNNLDKKK